ncbi:MAG: 8-amino-7-oxononanoate synthase [Candidatus Omnitrophota bacterium]|nr:8-amino-7-oxononanoate synthase [Candidatus Omnitrophota bacterium]
MADIEEFLKKRANEGLLRTLKPISSRHAGKIYFNKKEYIDFSSNDYLGLSGHPELIKAAKSAMDKFGTAACASRLMSGDLEIHHQLEEKVAQFKNKEAALVFNSGYQANIGIISALYAKGDCIFSDRLNHASIVDGILLSGAHFFRFQHNDAGYLDSLLQKQRSKFNKALIITESIFSMDGDRAPLEDLVSLKEKYDCSIMVDEAHAAGIFGRNGSGIVEQEGLEKEIDLIMGTFSKALGGFGAYLATSKRIVEYLINTSRSFIYSTALPPAIIACNLASIKLIKEEPYRRVKLLEAAQYFRDALKAQGFEVRGDSQIVPLIIGDNIRTIEFANRLQEKGCWVLPIRTPTVPLGEARLRFSLSFYHNREILGNLINDISGIKI